MYEKILLFINIRFEASKRFDRVSVYTRSVESVVDFGIRTPVDFKNFNLMKFFVEETF